MKGNYEVFEAEKPDWWTELLTSTIPDDFIPKVELKALEEEGVDGKRKRSVVGILGWASFVGEAEAEEGGGLAGLARRMSVGGRLAATVTPAVNN